MSRRKQAKPLKHLDDETLIINGQFGSLNEANSFNSVGEGLGSSSDPDSVGEEGSPPHSDLDPILPTSHYFLRHGLPDFALNHSNNHNHNNNNNEIIDEDEEDPEEEQELKDEKMSSSNNLKALTSSIANLTSLANGTLSKPSSIQELAVLSANLFNLQQQQFLQMKMLTQMQQQLQISQSEDPIPSLEELAAQHGIKNSLWDGGLLRAVNLSKNTNTDSSIKETKETIREDNQRIEREGSEKIESKGAEEEKMTLGNKLLNNNNNNNNNKNSSSSNTIHHRLPSSFPYTLPSLGREEPLESEVLMSSAPLSAFESDKMILSHSESLASSIIMHDDSPEEEKLPVNSLELLQKRAQGILNNASQGLLANNLADFSCSRDAKGNVTDRSGEPFFKHRCRYCGKVFGSDSALQIHVRSHTGERPYKCNICGNRFTTKGNLKVHFQRHSGKFPLIKMNPNLVPEHLDKFYPPLLQQIEDAEKKGLGPPPCNDPMAGMRPVIPPGMRMPSLPGMTPLSSNSKYTSFPPHRANGGIFPPFALPTEPLRREDIPANNNNNSFLLHSSSASMSPSSLSSPKIKEEDIDVEKTDGNHDGDSIDYETTSKFGGGEDEDEIGEDDDEIGEEDEIEENEIGGEENERRFETEPENLIKNRDTSESPLRLIKSEIHSETPIGPSTSGSGFDPAKDPNLYTNLLPRPGSNDNAWESLIEVARPSETAKLEALVNNIENKLSDPNECAICHRVLSCKSALQMHYRTHTGERPFKCRICGRAFTTKGNLKTHMGVHRAKPPLRMFHQCPVCHKKYANALVLQQHIRQHTGEPTELTAEQISAGEIQDSFHIRIPGSPLFPGLPPLMMDYVDGRRCLDDDDNDDDNDENDDENDENDDENESFMDDKTGTRPSSVSSSNSSNLPIISSSSSFLTPSALFSDSLSKMADSRPYSLVRPFFMESPSLGSSVPEDLSPIRKHESIKQNDTEEESPVSPPQISHLLRPPPSPPSKSSLESSISFRERLTPSSNALDLTPKTSGSVNNSISSLSLGLFSGFSGLPHPISHVPSIPRSALGSSPPTTTTFPAPLLLHGSPSNNSVPYSSLRLPFPLNSGSRLEFDFYNVARGNTTCQICFKVFACNSALEIHIRSHTKERPFKCDYCDRGFSTKGNMKQHALTHKASNNSGSENGSPNDPQYSTPAKDSTSDIDDEFMEEAVKSHIDGMSYAIKRAPSEQIESHPSAKRPSRTHGYSFLEQHVSDDKSKHKSSTTNVFSISGSASLDCHGLRLPSSSAPQSNHLSSATNTA